MKTSLLTTCLLMAGAGAIVASAQAQTYPVDNVTSYGKLAWEESAVPVRPGVPGKVPFWNTHAKRFIYAPAFDFTAVDGASKYHFVVQSDKTSASLTFEDDKPYAALSPIWN